MGAWELVPAGSDSAADAEPRWAKGAQRSGRGGAWSMAFQIRGRRHVLTLRCSQAEAAVAYDLAGVWSHRAKGNNPAACTRYNFPLAWYPAAVLGAVLAVDGWEGLCQHLARLAEDGSLRALVPFEGCGRRYCVTDAEAARPGPAQQLCVNRRGVHLFRGGWTCIPLADVHTFGCLGSLLQISYTAAGGRPGRGRATLTLRCSEAATAHAELAAAAAAARANDAPGPCDVGTAVSLLRLGGSGGREARRPASLRSFADGWEEEEGGGSDGDLCWSPRAGDACTPSPEELQLLADFADLARSASAGGSSGSPAGSGASNSGTGSPPVHVPPGPAADPARPSDKGLVPGPSTEAEGLGVRAEASPAAAPGTPGSPPGSSSSSRAGAPLAGALQALGQEGPRGKRAAAGVRAPAREPKRKRQRGGGGAGGQPGGAAAAAAAQQYTPAQQQYLLRMVQVMQMGGAPSGVPPMPHLMPLAAVGPAAAAACLRQQQQQQQQGAAAGGKAPPAAALPFCYAPVQHPGVPGGVAVVPVMLHPCMAAAAMQAQAAAAAARHMHAAAAAAGGSTPSSGKGAGAAQK